jgi:hypothetical protein
MVATRARWRVEFLLIGERETEAETEPMVGEEEGWRAKGVEEGTEERSSSLMSREECEGAGEGKAGYAFKERLVAGDDVVECVCDVDAPALGVDELGLLEEEGDDDEALLVVDCASLLEGEIPVGRPCAANALTTASQPRSRVLIRSLSSSFSRSLSCSRLIRNSSS